MNTNTNTNTNTNPFLSLTELNNKLRKYDVAKKDYLGLQSRLERERVRFNGNNNVASLEEAVKEAGEALHKIYSMNSRLIEARWALVLAKEFVAARFVQFRHDWTDLELMKKDGEVLLAVNGADIDGEEYVSVYYPDRTVTFYEKTIEEKEKEAESTKAKLRW